LPASIAVLYRPPRIEVRVEHLDIEVSPGGLYTFLGGSPAAGAEDVTPVHLSLPIQLCRVGQGKRMLVDAPASPGQARPDPTLVKLIARAHLLKEKLACSGGAHIAELAASEQLSSSYVTRLLRLAFLAPDITRAILEGRHPAGFTAQKLVARSALPLAWPEQRHALGFAVG
jgi:site-specific DNA recombinase